MSSGRGGIALIFGAAAAVVGGGGYYFIKVYQPRQVRRDAQTEILAWEARWQAARSCLLGDHPASSSPAEAVAIRELEPDLWNRNACTPLLGKLSRGSAPDTGLRDVEDAWVELDHAAGKLATAFVSHVDPTGNAPKTHAIDPLPGALAGLDAADATLRTAADMDALATSGAPLPRATIVPLALDTPLTELSAWLAPSAHGTIAFAMDRNGQVQIVLAPGAAPKVERVIAGMIRGVPDSTWGAIGLPGKASIGLIPPGGGELVGHDLPMSGLVQVQIAVGSSTDGIVAYGAGDQLVFAHSDAGTFITDKPISDIASVAFAEDPAGTGVVAWSDGKGAMRGVIAAAGKPTKIMDLGSGEPATACLTSDHAWVGKNGQYVAFDDHGAVPHVLPAHELVACSSTMALFHRLGAAQYVACGNACRIVDVPRMQSSSVAAMAGDEVVAVNAASTVIGVWREHGEARYFSTPTAVRPVFAHSDGKVIDVLAETDGGLTLVRLPVRK